VPSVLVAFWLGIGSPFLTETFGSEPAIRWIDEFMKGLSALALYAVAAALPLAGTSVFAGDQRKLRFRFLADRGISPGSVWWSRQSVWFVVIAIWFMLALAPLLVVTFLTLSVTTFQSGSVPGWLVTIPFWVGLYALASYSLGQLCSMLFRSGILCGTLALSGSLLLAGWG
jgi:hypothetical protein